MAALNSEGRGVQGVAALYCSEECRLIHDSNGARIEELERLVSDHAQRFDTAQSHQWKRAWFWFWGWPLTDWNAVRPNWRPWNRTRRVR